VREFAAIAQGGRILRAHSNTMKHNIAIFILGFMWGVAATLGIIESYHAIRDRLDAQDRRLDQIEAISRIIIQARQ